MSLLGVSESVRLTFRARLLDPSLWCSGSWAPSLLINLARVHQRVHQRESGKDPAGIIGQSMADLRNAGRLWSRSLTSNTVGVMHSTQTYLDHCTDRKDTCISFSEILMLDLIMIWFIPAPALLCLLAGQLWPHQVEFVPRLPSDTWWYSSPGPVRQAMFFPSETFGSPNSQLLVLDVFGDPIRDVQLSILSLELHLWALGWACLTKISGEATPASNLELYKMKLCFRSNSQIQTFWPIQKRSYQRTYWIILDPNEQVKINRQAFSCNQSSSDTLLATRKDKAQKTNCQWGQKLVRTKDEVQRVMKIKM